MRKILLGIITVILLAFAIYVAVYGVKIGGFEVSSIPAIQEKNENLDNKIEKATKLKVNDYQQGLKTLEDSYKKLMTEKENYEQLLELGVDENGLPLNKIQEYEIEKIWITMGNYANKEGVDLKMDIKLNNSINKSYDLEFTVTGGYIQITDFLYDIEKDSTLVFKLENYKMVPGESTDSLVATFSCRDIKLNISDNKTTTNRPTETKPEVNDTKTETNDEIDDE